MERRTFAKGAALAASALLLPSPARAGLIPHPDTRRVVVIGSGFGGSVAALRLTRRASR